MTEQVVDAEVVEPDEKAGELVPAPPPSRAEVLAPLDLQEVRGAMTKYQQGLQELLTADDWQGRPNADGSFVKKSGWRKIATWFSLSITLTTDEVERDEDGHILRAKVWARATAPNGRAADGDGYCSIDEPRFTNKDTGEPISKARYKLENDLRATASTRAINRAISNLVGMGAVSAEEMEGVERSSTGSSTQPASDKQIGFLVGTGGRTGLLEKAKLTSQQIEAVIFWKSGSTQLSKSAASELISTLKDNPEQGGAELLKALYDDDSENAVKARASIVPEGADVEGL